MNNTSADHTSDGAGLDEGRPFGAHLRMTWWRALVVVVAVPVVLLAAQVLFYVVAAALEGRDDPFTTAMTPVTLLANNLSVAVAALLVVLLTARLAGVPWRALLSSRRPLDAGRWVAYTIGATLLVGMGVALVVTFAPGDTGWGEFAVTGTTVALIGVIVVTSPLQSAGEELMFRAAMMPALASWVRPVRPALVLGVSVSSLVFAVIHGSSDPWLFGYYTLLGVCTALMAVLSRGLEAPIAFHVANNVLVSVLNSLFASGGTTSYERDAGVGGPSYLFLAAVNVAMVVLVWRYERLRATSRDEG